MIRPPDAALQETAKSPGGDDLGARVASALVLMPIGIGSALAGGPWLAGATAAAAVAMAQEWAKMSEPDDVPRAFAFALAGTQGAIWLSSWGMIAYALILLGLVGAASALRRRTWIGRLETFGGAFYIGAPCVAFLWLRQAPDSGFERVIALFLIVWATDSAAYFGGRLIGGPQLAPHFSPSKTWAGAACGLIAGTLAGLGAGAMFAQPGLAWAAAGAGLSLVAILGDLLESALKRRFGVKDSGRLIPGHGGVLDRLDSTLAAALAAGLTTWLAPDFGPQF